VTFVRTVLGDIDPAAMGVTYAHEHLVIVDGRPVEISPDFLLADVERMTAELRDAAEAGLRTAVDAMPADCGRDPSKLAELSRRSGVQVVAATGLHHERFYGPSHWSLRATEDDLADLFVADVELGIDARDYSGPIVDRTTIRAGIVKVAGSQDGPSDRDMPVFRAAAAAHLRTGVPVHTHCEAGTGALEQIRVLMRDSKLTFEEALDAARQDHRQAGLRARRRESEPPTIRAVASGSRLAMVSSTRSITRM
jgi:phosphotriesterase-related protein